METDSFFYQLLKQLPETLFQLLGPPGEQARAYRFDSVEVKKSYRIDGLLLPNVRTLPLFFVEVQFQYLASFYANLFAKVFGYLDENDPAQEWVAVAIFANRGLEPKERRPYQPLLESPLVKRIFLDEYEPPIDGSLGLSILQLVSASVEETKPLVARLMRRAESEIPHSDQGLKVVELVEELLVRRFTQLDREEIRKMFQLHDLRESKVWQEAHQDGIKEGKTIAHAEVARNLIDSGMPVKEVAKVLKISAAQVRRLAKNAKG